MKVYTKTADTISASTGETAKNTRIMCATTQRNPYQKRVEYRHVTLETKQQWDRPTVGGFVDSAFLSLSDALADKGWKEYAGGDEIVDRVIESHKRATPHLFKE